MAQPASAEREAIAMAWADDAKLDTVPGRAIFSVALTPIRVWHHSDILLPKKT